MIWRASGKARGRLNARSYVVWHKIALFLPQDDQKAPLKGVRTPGKQPGGLFPCEDGPAGPGMLSPQATEGFLLAAATFPCLPHGGEGGAPAGRDG